MHRNRQRPFVRTLRASLALTLLFFASGAWAGIHYKQNQSTHDEDKGKTLSEISVEGWVDGPMAKVVFVDSSDKALLKPGNFLLTRDAGKKVYLVDPTEETYMEWDIEAMLGLVGNVMDSMGDLMNIEFQNPTVEMLESKAGGTVAGLETQYRKFRTSYDLQMKIMGLKQGQSVETVQEVWGSPQTGNEALGIWLRQRPPKTNIDGLDEMIAGEMEKMEKVGYPLRSESRTVTTKFGRKGKAKGQTTVTQRTEVTLWENANPPADTFTLPDYEQIAMPMAVGVPPEEGSGDQADAEGENGKKKRSLRGLFKRN